MIVVALGIFFTTALFWSGCFRVRTPLGGDHEIRVVADSTIWQQAEPLLREIFEKVEYTPQPEKVFKIIKADLNNFKRFKNIIFLSTLDANDEISANINSSLSAEAKKEVEDGKNIIFIKKDQWAEYQFVMFLIGKDLPSLLQRIENQQSEIFFQFDNYWNEFHKEILYGYREQFDVEKHLLKNYGWMIRVPLDFKIVTQSAKDRFVVFLRKYPPRWFAVYWVEATDPNIITKDWCIAKRNEIAKIFFDEDSIEQKWEPVKSEEIIFLNRRALKLKGLWKNSDKNPDPAGGPFRLYCFFDEPQERIYFIDMHLYYPDFKKRKLHYLRQMEIMARTFKTNLEIKPEDIK